MKFFIIGLTVAALEEFISQGLIEGKPLAWIVPTLIAFTPFLAVMRGVGVLADRWWSPARASLVYYFVAGGIGLAFEWCVRGFVPWKEPSLLMALFQLGMFSFWVSVAFAPRLLMDTRTSVRRIRRAYRRSLTTGFALVYILTFTASKEARWLTGIGTILALFTLLNVFYFAYMRALARHPPPHVEEEGQSSRER